MRVERLTGRHDIAGFACGVKPLDDWLRAHALENQRRNLSRTFVLVDNSDEVIGYYLLTMGGVTKEELPHSLGRGLPNFEIGMILLARLAVGESRQREGLGRDLLVDAIHRAATAGQEAAARFVAVDPIDDSARRFYRHFGFRDIAEDAQGRMFMRIDEALTSFGDVKG